MKVSIFYYSMTRQNEAAARAVATALPEGAEAQLVRIFPTEPRWQLAVPFRPMWKTFFATLLPTMRGDAIAIGTEPPAAEWRAADAVVVGSATWWNYPCLPIRALLRTPEFRAHVAGKPVGLFAGCRGFWRKNLAVCGKEIASAGGRVVARERFSYTGSVLGTFLAFFAMLRFGSARARWLGLHVPPYGFQPRTLERARGFAARLVQPDEPPAPGLETAVRAVYTGLALFDLALAIAFIFFGAAAIGQVAPATYAEPQFFQRCVGLFLLQYVFVQATAARDPLAYSTCLNMTIAVRATFPVLYLAQVALWGGPWSTLHTLFVVSAAGDLGATAFTVLAMRRLGLPFFGGDATADDDAPESGLLRWILLVLAISEFCIAWNWLLLPRFWCGVFALAVPVDPFWTRATGLFLLNIAYIQFLAFRDLHRYRTAVATSGLFRMLWPVLYWVSVADRVGNEAFRAFILFFSFFDLTACFVIFGLLHRVTRQSEVSTTPNLAVSP